MRTVVLAVLGLVTVCAQTTNEEWVDLSMIELEAHEESFTPSFSVCKYLLESTRERLGDRDTSWPHVAQHIAEVRSALPPHVRTDCDNFIKHNKEDIMTNFLQIGVETAKVPTVYEMMEEQNLVEAQAQAKAEAAATQGGGGGGSASGGGGGEAGATDAGSEGDGKSASEAAAKYWEEKGQYCGACLTMTKKLSKWMQMACTQSIVVDRLMRMCGTMPYDLAEMCKAQKMWIAQYVLQKVANKFPLPNHCAYIGLCEKTAVIMSLQNPLVRSDNQNELMEELEGTSGKRQEDESVLSKAYKTPTSVPEITFNLGDAGGVEYNDVAKAQGVGLPSFYIDGTDAPRTADPLASAMLEIQAQVNASIDEALTPDPLTMYTQSLLELEESARPLGARGDFAGFDTTIAADPEVQLHGQKQEHVSVPLMHSWMNQENGGAGHQHSFEDVSSKPLWEMKDGSPFLKEAIPNDVGEYDPLATTIPTSYLKGCGACQFTLGALYEFLSNSRTIRALLPAIKKSCQSCNSAEEITKCESLVENHGVSFYQDVLRQASPQVWCPRLELCEINYFIPSPHVLPETYMSIKSQYDPDNIDF